MFIRRLGEDRESFRGRGAPVRNARDVLTDDRIHERGLPRSRCPEEPDHGVLARMFETLREPRTRGTRALERRIVEERLRLRNRAAQGLHGSVKTAAGLRDGSSAHYCPPLRGAAEGPPRFSMS